MKAYSGIGLFILVLLGTIGFFLLFWSTDSEPASMPPDSNIVVATPLIPDSLSFSGELVPTRYFDVRESLERELTVNTYWHSQTIWLLQKANRFFPTIEKILKENNIPDDFKYVAVAESGLGNIVSPVGATGFWQLMEGTAKDYNLEINSEIDERYHLEKATKVACDYFQESYKKYGNWTLAAASFNVGRRGIDRQIERQKETDYYNLLLNSETARYIYRILAFKLVFENPEIYSFNLRKEDLYKPYSFKEVEINTPIESWADFAKKHGTNYKLLKILNPWLRDSMLSNKSRKTYTVKIPKKNTRKK
jgi:hypothetical protein